MAADEHEAGDPAMGSPDLACSTRLRPHPSLGVPVGCLVVPSEHMKLVKATLSAAGKAGTQWLRKAGVERSAGGESFQVQLSIEGATRLEAQRDVPPELSRLISSGAVQWQPGKRPRRCMGPPLPLAPPPGVDPKCSCDRPRAPLSSPRFRFAELFAGIGGFRLALEALGGECVFASEIEPHAAATYALNFGAPPEAGDITEVADEDLPAHDLLVGGFPCQCFSFAGEQKGLSDDGRGQLYLEVCRVLSAARPAAFLLENVAGLYSLDGGSFHKDYDKRTPGRVHATIVADLEACGYTVSSSILGAHAFGVPQYRDRLYFVGFREPAAATRFEWPPSGSWNYADFTAAVTPTAAATAMPTKPVAAGDRYALSRTGRPLHRAPEGCQPLRTCLEPDGSVAVDAAQLTPQQVDKIRAGLADGSRVAKVDGVARTLMGSYRSGWHRHSEFLRTRGRRTLLGGEDDATCTGSGEGPADDAAVDVSIADAASACDDADDDGDAHDGACDAPAQDGAHDGARFFTAREAARLMGFPESYVIPGHPTLEYGGKAYESHVRFYRQIGNAVCPHVVEAVAEPLLRALYDGPAVVRSSAELGASLAAAGMVVKGPSELAGGARPATYPADQAHPPESCQQRASHGALLTAHDDSATSPASSSAAPPTITVHDADAFCETVSEQTTGGVIWEAARLLLSLIEAQPSRLSGKPSVLELGSGTGWLGMTLASRYDVSQLCMTEMVQGGALAWLESNLKGNRDAGVPLENVRAEAFDWSWVDDQVDDAPPGAGELLSTRWDVVLGSDLVYNEAGVQMLPRVLSALTQPGTRVLYAHTFNRFEILDHAFLEALQAHGLGWTEVWPTATSSGSGACDHEAKPESAADGDGGLSFEWSGELFPEQRLVVLEIGRVHPRAD